MVKSKVIPIFRVITVPANILGRKARAQLFKANDSLKFKSSDMQIC